MKKNNIQSNIKKSEKEDQEKKELSIVAQPDRKSINTFLKNKKKRAKELKEEEQININKVPINKNIKQGEEKQRENKSDKNETENNFNNFTNFNTSKKYKPFSDKYLRRSEEIILSEEEEENIFLDKFKSQTHIINLRDTPDKPTNNLSLKKEILDLHPNFQLSQFRKEMDDLRNISTIPKPFYSRQKMAASTEFIKRALDGLKIEDEMVVLSVLSELSSELSMASDIVGDDMNIHYLLKELIMLFDKYFMLPDISMSALTCLNYILDLNVRLTSSIIKYGGVKKIVNMTQNIDYIDCAENAIKAIEKMSIENPFHLLEMDAFVGVLSLIDFFDLNLRKSALRACVNMSKAFNGVEQVRKFVFPALPSLANLTKYTGNSEIEKNILDLAVQCYYNIIYYVKIYNMSGSNENFCNSLIQFGFLENIFELFVNFLGVENKTNDFKESDATANNTYKMNIQIETFKNIIRLFEMFCSLSAEITNNIFKFNILEILHLILSKELSLDSTKKRLSSGSASCYIEIFNLLISFFPNKKSKQPDRLLSEFNKHYYIYFSEKILSFLLNNIVNISSSNTMVLVVKLVEMFIKNSNAENIHKYIDPVKLSNIAGKMLDCRDSSYIIEIFNLVEVIMNKVPESFYISFLREGVVDNIKTLTEIEENKLYIPNDPTKLIGSSSYLYTDPSQINQLNKNVQHIYSGNDDSYGDDVVEEDELIEDWDLHSKEGSENSGNLLVSSSGTKSHLIKEKLNENACFDTKHKEFLDYINKKIEMKTTGNKLSKENTIFNTNNFNNFITMPFDNKDNETKFSYNPLFSKSKISQTENQPKNNKSSNSNLPTMVDISPAKEYENLQESISSIANSNVNPYSIVEDKLFKKLSQTHTQSQINSSSNVNTIVTLINLKAKEIIEKYFKDEDFDNFILRTKSTVDPREILQKLNNIKEILKSGEKVDASVLSFLFETILSKDKLTFYEIEKSEVILYLTKFLDENFFQNYQDTTETDFKTTSNISGFYNKKIIQNLKMIINGMNNDVCKINDFLKILQYCISSMNCFKLFLYDTGSSKYPAFLLTQFKNAKIKMKFVYTPKDNSNQIEDEIPQFKEIFEYFRTNKFMTLVFEQSENFQGFIDAMMKFREELKEMKEIKESNIQSTQSVRDEYFEEIFTHLRNRKGSEEDIQFTEKILQRLIERKKSSNSEYEDINHINEEGQNTNSNITITEQTKEKEGDLYQLISNIEANFYVVINNNRMEIKSDWSISELIRELKSFYKRHEYATFINDIQINFELTLKNKHKNIDSNILKNISSQVNYKKSIYEANFGEKIKLDIETNIEHIKKGNYENMLLERYYRDNLINNSSLYCIKRASPFFYLIALLDLSVNHFRNLFAINEENSTLNTLSNLENLKVTTLLFKQAKDPYSVSSGNLPKWCKELCQNFTYLSGFNSRYLLFKVSSFDNKRSLSNLYIYLKNFMGETILEDKTLSQNKRHRFKVDRNNILKDTDKLMREFQGYKGYLEFEYHDEVGTGLGPTLEFYSLFSREIRNLNNIWYKTDDYSLFPCPIDINNPLKTEDNIKIFKLVGFVIARGLYDDRLIDFPINSLFWDLVLDRPISFDKIKKIDRNLGKTIQDFVALISYKQRVINTPKFKDNNSDINDFVTYKNVRIDDLGLNFTLPGYPEIELKRGGDESLLTVDNIEEYASLLFDKLILSGCKPYLEAFKSGFNKVFPITNMKTFTSAELEDIICGCPHDKWEYESLIENIIPAHGYHKNSQIFTGLIEILINMNSMEKKKFLLFSTGSPRLPLGGFKNLTPKLTVVLKKNHIDSQNPDDYLPTVMTCQNFLKIPEYSNVDILRQKLLLAMEEGSNAFHLS